MFLPTQFIPSFKNSYCQMWYSGIMWHNKFVLNIQIMYLVFQSLRLLMILSSRSQARYFSLFKNVFSGQTCPSFLKFISPDVVFWSCVTQQTTMYFFKCKLKGLYFQAFLGLSMILHLFGLCCMYTTFYFFNFFANQLCTSLCIHINKCFFIFSITSIKHFSHKINKIACFQEFKIVMKLPSR